MTSQRSDIYTRLVRISVAFALLAGSAFVAGGVYAANGFTNHNPDDPIRFTADRLEVKREGRVAAFIGNVEAYQVI